LTLLSGAERSIGGIYQFKTKLDMAENFCRRTLCNARLFNEKKVADTSNVRTDLLCQALKACSDVQVSQRKFVEAIVFAEEAYDCVAMAFDPVHPEVQDAASTLIECLIKNVNYYDAERFAEATLNSLKDPANGLDQLSMEVAMGYYNLASATSQQKVNTNLVEVEMLARESLRIRTLYYGKIPNGFVGKYTFFSVVLFLLRYSLTFFCTYTFLAGLYGSV
jgi:hypothetical protein